MASYDLEVKRRLREHGWALKRQGKGSHEIWSPKKQGGAINAVTVPHKIKSKITANEIMKQAGLDHRFR